MFYLIVSSVSATMGVVFEVVICWLWRNRIKVCYVFDSTVNRGKEICDYVLRRSAERSKTRLKYVSARRIKKYKFITTCVLLSRCNHTDFILVQFVDLRT